MPPPPLTTAVSHNYAVFFCDSVNYHRDSSRCFLHSNCIVCFNYSCMHHSSWTLRPLLCILLFSPPKLHSVPSMLFIWGGAAVIKKGYLDPSTSSLSQEAGYSFPLCGQWTSCRIDKKTSCTVTITYVHFVYAELLFSGYIFNSFFFFFFVQIVKTSPSCARKL